MIRFDPTISFGVLLHASVMVILVITCYGRVMHALHRLEGKQDYFLKHILDDRE